MTYIIIYLFIGLIVGVVAIEKSGGVNDAPPVAALVVVLLVMVTWLPVTAFMLLAGGRK